MTFQQHLEEQVIKLRSHKQTLNTISDEDFLRQSNIETVKWVIKFIYKTTPEDSIETQRLDKNLLDDKYFIAGHDAAINDLVCELNKSIEDHA